MKLLKAVLSHIQSIWPFRTTRRYTLLFILGLASPICFASDDLFAGAQGQYGVGLHVVQLVDHSRAYANKVDMVTGKAVQGGRARPIQALVWYPTVERQNKGIVYNDYLRASATTEKFSRTDAEVTQAVDAYLLGEYPDLDKNVLKQPMLAKRDAPPATGTFPVIVYAPGASGLASDNADLCEYLASHGYLVIASASMGSNNRSMTVDLAGAETQARDISFLLGYASTLPQADVQHVAAMGYSVGGLANVLAAAKDDRISALVSLDGSVRYFPAIVQKAGYATPERLALPMLYLGSRPYTAELMNRVKQVPTYSLMNEMKFSDLYNVTMNTMDHPAFQSQYLRLASDQRFGEYSRTESLLAHRWMGRYVLAFLDAYLRSDATALKFMNNTPAKNDVPAHLLYGDVHHSEGAPPTLATMASRFASQHYRDLAGIYLDMSKREPTFKPDERSLISWGEQFLDANRAPEAVEIILQTTTLYPDSPRAFFYLGMAYDKNNDTARSIKAYQRVLAFWPDDADTKQNIQRLQAKAKSPVNK
jgi:pimeloyl-ACP methyl ester carboxylesterase